MQDSTRLSRHFWQTQGMARSVGVDLNGALQSGRLLRSRYEALIAECYLCAHADACLKWMAMQGRGAKSAPGYCALKVDFEALRDS
ncbi:DUF6455 family protein [Actibacterium sp.]|uniref:DUF6455 family protein n=1 Tax=Actibacterium sp. TaxID=1872125 RepID=UPI0035641FE1